MRKIKLFMVLDDVFETDELKFQQNKEFKKHLKVIIKSAERLY